MAKWLFFFYPTVEDHCSSESIISVHTLNYKLNEYLNQALLIYPCLSQTSDASPASGEAVENRPHLRFTHCPECDCIYGDQQRPSSLTSRASPWDMRLYPHSRSSRGQALMRKKRHQVLHSCTTVTSKRCILFTFSV